MAWLFDLEGMKIPGRLLVHDRIAHLDNVLEDLGPNWVFVRDRSLVSDILLRRRILRYR
jgi:hypothetical protein